MNKFCSNCGKELKEDSDVCLNCGVILNGKKNKIPGNGVSIAGMILGIISSFWAFMQILSSGNIEYSLLNLPRSYIYETSISFVLITFGLGYTLFSLIPSLVGLPLSIVGFFKQKSGKNIAGIILNSVALIVSIIMFIYILSFAK